MEERWIVLDEKGIIHESGNYSDAMEEYSATEDFEGDLIFCQIICRRR